MPETVAGSSLQGERLVRKESFASLAEPHVPRPGAHGVLFRLRLEIERMEACLKDGPRVRPMDFLAAWRSVFALFIVGFQFISLLSSRFF